MKLGVHHRENRRNGISSMKRQRPPANRRAGAPGPVILRRPPPKVHLLDVTASPKTTEEDRQTVANIRAYLRLKPLTSHLSPLT